jgi:hypothetical protein
MPTVPVATVELRHYAVTRQPEGGVLDYDRLRQYVADVVGQMENGPPRVLVDARHTARTYSFAEAFRLVEEFSQSPALRRARVAILGDFERNFEKPQAIEAFSRDAGLDVRAFLDYEAAVRYLMGLDAPSEPGMPSADLA